MKILMKIASVTMAAAMIFSSVSFSASAAAKKAVDSKNTAKGIKISWNKTAKAGKYKVLRSTSKNGSYTVVGKTKKTAFTDKTAKAGKTYYYTVKATKANTAYKVEKATRLTAPTLKSVIAEETGCMVTLNWSKVKGAKSYGIYYATVKDGKTGKFENLYSVYGTTTETIVLDEAGTYAFKIVAEKGDSKSAYSNIETLDFVKTPDVLLSVGETDNTIVDIVEMIEEFGAAFGMTVDVVATWEIADLTIISIGEDYVITGLAAGETTFDLTLSYEFEGEEYSETTTLSVVVKGEEPPVVTITEDEAIELVKAELSGEEFSYIPADEIEEIDGNQYYVIYVKVLTEGGNLTTVATYMVKTDGTEVFDKDADVSTTITEDEAIELVKAELSGEGLAYIPADELEEKDGNQYYVIYVKILTEGGNYTTVATYLVNTDGTEVIDKDATL